MKSRKTKKSAPARKAGRSRKLLQTTARYVYWYGVAHPQFGQTLLATPQDSLQKAVKKQKFALSPDEMAMLNAFLNDGTKYPLTGRQLLQGVCDLKLRRPPQDSPREPAAAPAAAPATEGATYGAGIPIEKVPPNPPPPWG